MATKFGKHQFKRQGISDRLENDRSEREVPPEKTLLCFNLKDFDRNQCPPGQKYEDWQRAGLLSALMEKLQQLSQKTLTEAQQEGMITIYKNFPPLSDFKVPKHIRGSVNWAAIKDVKGQKGRVAGYVDGNVFYIVFLDKEHKFYKMRKK